MKLNGKCLNLPAVELGVVLLVLREAKCDTMK